MMDIQAFYKRELAKKLSSSKDIFKTEMANLLTTHWDNITTDLINQVDMVFDQEKKLSDMNEEHNLTLTNLKSENGSLQEKLSEMTGDQD